MGGGMWSWGESPCRYWSGRDATRGRDAVGRRRVWEERLPKIRTKEGTKEFLRSPWCSHWGQAFMRGQEVVCPWPVIKSSMRVRKTIDRYGGKCCSQNFVPRPIAGALAPRVCSSSCNANARNISPMHKACVLYIYLNEGCHARVKR